MKRGYLFSPDSPTEAELVSAEEFEKLIAERHNSNTGEVDSYDPPTAFMYGLERFLVNRLCARLIYSKTFLANRGCQYAETLDAQKKLHLFTEKFYSSEADYIIQTLLRLQGIELIE